MHHSKELSFTFILMLAFFFAVLFRLIVTAHYVSPITYHWPVLMLQKYNI